MKRRPKTTGKGYELERGAVKKSRDGRRTVALPPRAFGALKAHKSRQAAEKLAAGALYHDQGLIFASEVGTPVDPSDLRRVFARIAKRPRRGLSILTPARPSPSSWTTGPASRKLPTSSATTLAPCTGSTGTR
jgi:hypothetical protein